MKRVAILYICTGKYNQFFYGFYESAEEFFLRGVAEVEYFVWTDDENLSQKENVHIIKKVCEGFPADSLFRFEMFLQVKEQLYSFDFVFFFNSNALFKAPVGDEFIAFASDCDLLGARWRGLPKPFNLPCFYPYERNKKSAAYIAPHNSPYLYYMGGLNGGKTESYLKMAETLARNIRNDYEKGIIACVHDESHINRYFREHKPFVVPFEYAWPEEWIADFSPKIVFRDKVKLDQYFNKGRKNSLGAKVSKCFRLLWRALIWYM